MADDARQIVGAIDHSVLKPDATEEDVRAACELGKRLEVAAVCVQPCWVELAAELLRDSPVKPATVAGFPHGASDSPVKLLEILTAAEAGAKEVDMVINVGWLKSGKRDRLQEELVAAAALAHASGVVLKVILETCYLTDEEKVAAAKLAAEAGADFVKTSTGFGPGGATVEDVRLLRGTVPEQVGVKAAGGVRTAEQCRQLMAAGATRIGTSATEQIARELGAL